MNIDILLREAKREMPEKLAQQRERRSSFEERLYAKWKNALDLFELVMLLALEEGERFNQKYAQQAEAENDIVFDVLHRLQVRACHIASEIQALLFSGHATAAMARWRTLHEVAVVCCLIEKHQRDLAERYLLHETIEGVKAMEEYQQYCGRLGYSPLAPDKIAQAQAVREELIQRFGRPFGKKYGWAANALRKDNPQFTDLDQAAGLDHMRPYYRMASHGVHSNPKAITFGMERGAQTQFIIGGPSIYGLAEPGHATLIALLQCTDVLLRTKTDAETDLVLQALGSLVDEAGQAFLAVHQQLESERETSFPAS